MANEAVIIELVGIDKGRPIRYTCADNTTILKGTLLELSGDRTVQASTTANAPFVGIAAAEKVANDGATEIAAYTNGIFDLLSDAGVDNRGVMMALSAVENVIETGASADWLTCSNVGHYLEAGTNAGTEAVRINK